MKEANGGPRRSCTGGFSKTNPKSTTELTTKTSSTKLLNVCTLTLMLLVSASSFTLQKEQPKIRHYDHNSPASRSLFENLEKVSTHAATSASTRLQVATSHDVDAMPELGKNGVYSILNEAQHKALIKEHEDKLVVLKVFAPWCRACKGLEPKFNALVKDEKYEGLPIVWADLTIQHNKDYVKSIGVLALPTVQFYAHGQKIDTFPCGPSKVPVLKKKLEDFVNQNIDFETRLLKPPSSGITLEQLPAGAEAATSTKPVETAENVAQKVKSKLRSIVYFSDMLESEFDSVLSKATLLTFDSGSIIMREGNPGRTFYYIVEGEVEICQRTSFEDPLTLPPSYLGTVINRFETGDYFGERALIVGEPRAASIRASTTTKCLAFDKDNFPPTCVLSGQAATVTTDEGLEAIQVINDKYGVALSDFGAVNDKLLMEASKANQERGSPNTPRPIDGVDNDIEEEDFDAIETPTPILVTPATKAQIIVPLLIRFKLIRLVTRCFDYIVENKPKLSDPSVRRRRELLVNLLSPSQHVEFTDAYNLIDLDGDGVITLVELRKLMDSIGEDRSDDELMSLISQSRLGMDGKEVITYRDFMGLMAESEFYFLFLDTFRSLDKMDTGFVRAKDLDRVLCGIRDLITDDRRSIIDVEDTEMMVDYEQFSRMLLGTSLN